MARHPSENFIKYLITCGHQLAGSDDWIRMMVTSLSFPLPESNYLLWLRNNIAASMPADFEPQNRYHTESRKFLKAEGIFGMHMQTREVIEANGIVINNRARDMIQALILGRLDPKDIAKKVNSKLASFYTEGGIDAYRHYYWQVGIIRVEEWPQIFADNDYQKQHVSSIVQVGPAMALHKTGFQQAIDSKSMLRTMQETLFFDFQEWKTKKHGSERTKAMTNIVKSAVMVDEALAQSDSALKDSLKAFEQFRMETQKVAVPDMRALAPGGNFSGSGAKLIDVVSKEKEEEDHD